MASLPPKVLWPFAVLALIVGLAACGGSDDNGAVAPSGEATTGATTAEVSEEPKVVGISQLVPHPSLDDHVRGVIARLEEEGFVDGENFTIEIENAQGEIALTKTIADKLVADGVDVLVSVTTPSSQAAAQAAEDSDVQVVFTAVTDPLSAGLLETVDEPSGTNITGMYNQNPLEEQIDLFLEIMPDLERLGVIYNAAEANSVADVERLREIAEEKGIELVEASVANSNEVQTVSESLVRRADAVYMPQDNTVVSALEALVQATRENDVPLFAGDGASVERGAVATVGWNDYDAGYQAGGIVARVLRGEPAGEIEPEPVGIRQIFVNTEAAAAVGLEIPESVLAEAEDRAGDGG